MGPKHRESGRELPGHLACTIAITWRCGLMIERPGLQASLLLFISHRETSAHFCLVNFLPVFPFSFNNFRCGNCGLCNALSKKLCGAMHNDLHARQIIP